MIMKERLTNEWPKGWICVGGGKNVPGYASIQSAEIAISKNRLWRENALDIAIVPFDYNDGAATKTRFAIFVKVEVEEIEAKEFYSVPEYLANEIKLAKKSKDESRLRRLRRIIFVAEDAYDALPEEKKGGVWNDQRIKDELNISI